MAKLLRKRAILAKIETTEGTDAVPVSGTNDVLCGDITVTPLAADYKERNIIMPNLGSVSKLPVGVHAKIEFAVELCGMQALGVPTPGKSALLRCCALSETIVALTSVTYAPIDSATETATIYFNLDGRLHKITGARGSVSFACGPNEYPSMKFSITGLFNAVTDTPAGTPDFSGYKLPLEVNSVNTVFSLHAYAGVMTALEIDTGVQVGFRDLPGGGKLVRMSDRQASGSVGVETDTIANINWYSIIQAGTTGALSFTHGPSGNQVVIAAPAVQLSEPKYGDSEGISTDEMGMALLPVSGNDEFSIVFK